MRTRAHYFASASTFIYINRTYILSDPSAFEESLLEASLTVVLLLDDSDKTSNTNTNSGASSILSVVQGGAFTSSTGERLDPNAFVNRCIDAAKLRREELRELLIDVL